jgi:hypothetical protein
VTASLTFDLNSPDDREAHLRAVHADAMWLALSRVVWWSKHQVPETGEEMLRMIRETVYEEVPNLNDLGQ